MLQALPGLHRLGVLIVLYRIEMPNILDSRSMAEMF
ncbi:MAG: hypothetical protein PARBA_03091 [Parabacteroides sp.]